MVRAGLGPEWTCTFANDFDHKKSATYRRNWGDGELKTGDVRQLTVDDLPEGAPDLIWASFPCQDLSLAGGGAGLKGNRSGTFWPFWDLVAQMKSAGRVPQMIVLENVCGTLTSHEGKDFRAIVKAFSEFGFDVGAIVVDAELFVPQSRPRLFFIGVPQRRKSKKFALLGAEQDTWHTPALKRAFDALSPKLKEHWIWWNMPLPERRTISLSNILESDRKVAWNSDEETDDILSMMSQLNRKKVEVAQMSKKRVVGTMYRRTRPDGKGTVQRVEVRFDGIAGCLRTPAGGSSRQSVLVVDSARVRSRLMTARETARLMGLPDSYVLPDRYNEAYHLTGDGVVVPVISHLSRHVLLPTLTAKKSVSSAKRRAKAA